jgi:hypothetical protein
MTTYKCWVDDPEFCAEVDQFDLHDNKSIAKHLRRIDLLRQQLINTQNDLAALLTGAPQYTLSLFAKFYHGGGVTKADWLEYNDPTSPTYGRDQNSRDYGQLRVINGNGQAPAPKAPTPRWRPPNQQGGTDGGPQAA